MGKMENEEKIAQETPEKEEVKASKKAQKQDKKASAQEQKIKDLEAKVEDLTQKNAEAKDNYMRLMADFDNFRRRSSESQLKLVSSASADVIKGILPVLDDFERALKMLREADDSAASVEGTELIYNKLMAFLKTKGLEPMEAKGQPFDTDRHEAVAQFPVQDEELKGKVFDVALTGYLLNGEVLRYAKVVVGI